MGLYGNEYFVTDRLSVLEEALNNELSNFDSIIESFDIESINEMRMASRPEIVIRRTISDIVEKIKELWEKFINWFKKAIKDINIVSKKTNMERLALSAKKVKDKEPTKDINNVILYSIRTDGTEHYKQTHSDIAGNIKEVSYSVNNFQKLNKEIFSHLDKLNINNLSGDTNIQAANIETIDKIKELENLQDSFKFEKVGSMDTAYSEDF